MSKLGDWLNKKTQEGKAQIEEGVADALMQDELNPKAEEKLRQHKGEPLKNTKKDKK